jgi:hypothetical protein
MITDVSKVKYDIKKPCAGDALRRFPGTLARLKPPFLLAASLAVPRFRGF